MATATTSWVSGPNGRGTLDIIWSCVFVVFLSTWTTLHSNVPPVKSSTLARMRDKGLLMCVGLLAPEYLATIAFTELRTALIVRNHMRTLGYQEWTLAHSFFVAMGGYVAYVKGEYKPISAENFIKWQRKGSLVVARSPDAITGRPASHLKTMALTEVVELPRLAKAHPVDIEGPPLEVPWISEEDLSARSKADFFLKSIACAQIAWLLVEYIARRAQSLPTSSLEALTVAYVVCALFSYCAWWKKPYDLESPTTVAVSAEHELSQLLQAAPGQVPMNDDPDLELLRPVLWTYIVPCVAAVLSFSTLHFLAWDDYFNTTAEKWLWRSSSIFFVWFHVVFLGFAAHMERNMHKPPTAANIAKIGNCAEMKAIWHLLRVVRCLWCGGWETMDRACEALLRRCPLDCTPGGTLTMFFCSHTLVYFAGRFFVLIEAFASFRRVPVGLYDTVSWTTLIPHVH